MNAVKQIHLMTLKEYEATPEDERIEVFEGFPYAMSAPSIVHQRILGELHFLLKDYIKKHNGKCETFVAPCDVKLNDSPLTILQPDLFIVCDPDKLDNKCCNGAPDFIIEIVSSGNAANDYTRKLYYYEHFGVKEYWIVDPDKKFVTVYDFANSRFCERYTFDDRIKVEIYDNLYIDFAPLKEFL